MKGIFELFGLAAGSLFWATSAFAVITCPGTLNGSFDVNDDVSQTSAGTCITVASSNVTVNLHGHTIYCNYAAGCASAFQVANNASNTTIKTVKVAAGTATSCGGSSCAIGHFTIAINNGILSGVAATTTVSKATVEDDGAIGVLNPYSVEDSVMRGSRICIISFGSGSPNGRIEKNYCRTNGGPNDGGILVAPSSGAQIRVMRNYIHASDTAYGLSVTGPAIVEHNIVANGLASAPTTGCLGNIDSNAYFPEPDSNFSLSVDFDCAPLGM